MRKIFKYNFDISEDYHSFKGEAWFNKNIGSHFKLDVYESDSDSDDSDYSYDDDNDYITVIKNMPTQLFFIEKLDGILSDLLQYTADDLLEFKNFGQKSADEVCDNLKTRFDLDLRK